MCAADARSQFEEPYTFLVELGKRRVSGGWCIITFGMSTFHRSLTALI